MRVLGIPIETPQTIVNRLLADVGAVARLARLAPAQLERLLELGEEMAGIGRGVLEIAERLDRRAEAIMALGERLDRRAEDVLAVGDRLDRRAEELLLMGAEIQALGGDIDARGAEIVDRATRVVETGGELITALPAFERALEMATPLEGAIDRFGRLVDRLPGGTARRRQDQRAGRAEVPFGTAAETPLRGQARASRLHAEVDPDAQRAPEERRGDAADRGRSATAGEG